MSIKEAAEECGVNYENAKAIARVFRKERRTVKREKPIKMKAPFIGLQKNQKSSCRQRASNRIQLAEQPSKICQELFPVSTPEPAGQAEPAVFRS